MARDHDGNWVRSIGQPNGAAGIRIADPTCKLSVRGGLTIRNLLKFAPHFLLEGSALRRERKIEVFKFASEVRLELTDSFRQGGRIFHPLGIGSGWPAIGREQNLLQAIGISRQQ